MDPKFIADALAAGFTEKQAAFLWNTFALDPHEHSISQVEGLPAALEALGGDLDEDEEDEDEEDEG